MVIIPWLVFKLSPGRKNSLAPQRCSSRCNIKVFNLGFRVGKFVDTCCIGTIWNLKWVIKRLWLQGIISAVLTSCSTNQGLIPINKNLWWVFQHCGIEQHFIYYFAKMQIKWLEVRVESGKDFERKLWQKEASCTSMATFFRYDQMCGLMLLFCLP